MFVLLKISWCLSQEKTQCSGFALICTGSTLLPNMYHSSVAPFITVRMFLRPFIFALSFSFKPCLKYSDTKHQTAAHSLLPRWDGGEGQKSKSEKTRGLR